MMSLQRNYYEVLGLPPGATTDQIKKKYRELARKFHPDVVQDKTLGQRVFTQINQAYSVLGDPERRAQYNGTLAQLEAPRSPAPSAAGRPADAAQAKPAAAPQTKPAAAAPSKPSAGASDLASAARKSQAFNEMLGRAENAIMAGKPVEARAFCVRVLETDPRQARALEILGDALVQMGRREEAAVQYRSALEISPSTMVQSKLNRATQAMLPTRTIPPGGTAQNASGSQRTNPPAGTETEKSGSLLNRLLGRK